MPTQSAASTASRDHKNEAKRDLEAQERARRDDERSKRDDDSSDDLYSNLAHTD